MRYKRDLASVLRRMAEHFPCLVLSGARQSGKTTLLREVFGDYHYVSLDVPAQAELAERNPEQFLEENPAPVLIDEVQYSPGIFRNLKVVIDQDIDRKGIFILTGSQKFNLMKEVSESLAGRAGIANLENSLGSGTRRFL